MFHAPVHPQRFVEALQEVGLLPESDYITGVQITVDPERPVEIMVSMEADERIYDIVSELAKDPK